MKRIGLLIIGLLSLGGVWALESNEEITVLQGLQEDGNFSTLVSLLESTGLAEQLSGTGGFTLFAPTNQAFDELGADRMSSLADDSEALTQVLQGHVLTGVYSVLDLSKAEVGSLMNASDESFGIAQTAGGLTVNGVNLVAADIDNVYSDGIVHVVSEVIMPASMMGGDTNGDGVVDNNDMMAMTALADTNGDGLVNGDDITDSNSDGVTDEKDYIAAGINDSNNDGVVDAFDITTTNSDTPPMDTTTITDMNGDGVADMVSITDTNNDGVIDSQDVTDANGDGIVDQVDLMALGVVDVNGDGLVDGMDMTDINHDGMIDAADMNATTMTDNSTTDTSTVTVVMDSDEDGQNNCEDENDGIDSDGDGTDADQCRAS